MNRANKPALLLAGLLACSPCALAQEYMFSYTKLYSQLKHNLKPDFPDVKTGIYFVDAENGHLCQINKAWMEKEQHYEELTISKTNELQFPLDDNLKQANPLIFVDTPQGRRCDFSLVVHSRHALHGKVNKKQVVRMVSQMQLMLENLGGMFARFFTPKVEGLTLEFAQQSGNILLSDGRTIPIEQGRALLRLSDLNEDGYVELPAATNRVLPWLPAVNK